MNDEIKFGMLGEDGIITDTRVIKFSDIHRCSHLILAPEHYRANGSCRCDDPKHTVMEEWGYIWKDGRWR